MPIPGVHARPSQSFPPLHISPDRRAQAGPSGGDIIPPPSRPAVTKSSNDNQLATSGSGAAGSSHIVSQILGSVPVGKGEGGKGGRRRKSYSEVATVCLPAARPPGCGVSSLPVSSVEGHLHAPYKSWPIHDVTKWSRICTLHDDSHHLQHLTKPITYLHQSR